MKQTIRILYILLFFILSAIPAIVLCMAENPDYTFTTPGETDTYLVEHFPFRDNYIATNSHLQETLLATAAVDEVVVGQDDILFFQETVADFTGTDPMSDRDLEATATTLSLIAEYAKSQGCTFALAVAPNKNSIYPDKMPANYLQLPGPSNWERLQAILPGNVTAVDLFTPLRNEDKMLYLYGDSHWNNEGALLGFTEILKALDATDHLPTVVDTTWRKDFQGDLTAMLYPKEEVLEDQIYYTFDTGYDYLSRFRGVDDLSIQTQCEQAKDSIVVFRDSFGNALLEDFASSFHDVQYSRIVPYAVHLAQDADYMVLEIVERNLENLILTAPKMIAPIRTNVTSVPPATTPVMDGKETREGYHVYGYFEGTVPEALYLQSQGQTYQAFPILESALDCPNSDTIVGFSAYLPKGTDPNTITLAVSPT